MSSDPDVKDGKKGKVIIKGIMQQYAHGSTCTTLHLPICIYLQIQRLRNEAKVTKPN